VGRVVEAVPEVRQDGDVMIIPIVEEEVVLVTRLVLREEIHIRTKTTRRTEQFTVNLRAERAEITRNGVAIGEEP
jgi:stress response protein YsnF